MNVVDRRLVSNAIRDRLAAQITWLTGVEVADRNIAPPCIVVDPIQGGTMTNMLTDAETVKQGGLPYQLTCIGGEGADGRERAEFMATAAIEALTGWSTDIVLRVHVDAWGNARPDEDVTPPVWLSQPMVRATARAQE